MTMTSSSSACMFGLPSARKQQQQQQQTSEFTPCTQRLVPYADSWPSADASNNNTFDASFSTINNELIVCLFVFYANKLIF